MRRFVGGRAPPSVKSSAAACPTELPDHTSYIREGWMYKRGGSHGGRANWKRRWFVLHTEVLYYLENPTDRAPRGRVELSGCDVREASAEVSKPNAFGIYNRLSLAEAPFFCHTETEAEMGAWELNDAAKAAAAAPQ